MSNNTVYAINEDTLGFIWIGTRSGLNRYDGYQFRNYDEADGLGNVFINTIYRDSKGRLWVGTQGGGLSLFHYDSGRFETFSNKPGDSLSMPDDDVQAIAQDESGVIWAGTHEGSLVRFVEDRKQFQRVNLKNKLPPGFRIDRINTLSMGRNNILWIGTLDGLFRFYPSTGSITPVLVKGKPLGVRVMCIHHESNGRIWAGTSNGIVRFDRSGNDAEFINTSNSRLSNDLVLDIEQSPDGQILIATDGGGLNSYNLITREIRAHMGNPNSSSTLSNNSVYEIFIDRYNGLWIGNYIGGINYYSEYDWKFLPIKHEVNDPESLSDNHVRSFFQDKDGFLWIGTLGGLNRYDATTRKFTTYTFSRNESNSLSSNSVLSIFQDHEGYLWIGTFGGGISIFDTRRKVFRKFTHPGDVTRSLDKANIYGILETANNKMVLGSLGGIYVIDKTTGRLRRYQSSNSDLSNNTVKVLYKDRQGYVWAGTARGLNRFDPESGEFKVFLHSNTGQGTLSNNRILSILESRDGRIWAGTEGGGVSILDPGKGKFTTLGRADGLPDNVVNSMLQDDAGLFWLGTNKGLVRYDPLNRRMRIYTMADGLQANEFNQNAAFRDRDGKLYFGGISGFNVFMPGNLSSNPFQPKVLLTDLFIANKPVGPGEEGSPIDKQIFLLKKLTLGYQTNFAIQFAALGFINKGKYQYSYMLRGFDDTWTDFRDIRTANYPNLRPGRYTFMVRAMNNDGITNEVPTALEIQILSPWWKTWWAYIMYTVLISGLLYLLMRYNLSWIRVKNQLMLERREKEQQEELNQLKLGFFTNISHEFKTPLTLILGHLDNLKNHVAGKQAETLQHIETNAKRLLQLINQLLEFRKAEVGLMKLRAAKANLVQLISGIKESFDELALRKEIGFEIVCNDPIPEIWFDPEKIEKIMYNLLSNAFRYVDAGGKITIILSVNDRNMVEVSVSDTGAGIAAGDLGQIFERFYSGTGKDGKTLKMENSGIGLAYSKRLVELHHGEIVAASEPGTGTVFTFRLPVGKDHLKDEEIREDSGFELKLDYNGLTGDLDMPVRKDPDPEPADEGKPVLLVVDDNPSICSVLAGKFSPAYQVLTACDGREGLDKALKFIPDVIISDVLMPVMDGIEFCQRIKKDIQTCHIPVILLTARSGDENQILGIKTGADAFIAKPYNPELLQVTVENLVVSRKILRNKFIGQEAFIPAEMVSNKLDEQFLVKLIALIEESPDPESIDILSLCREVAMSRSVLYRKLKAITGNSIQDFVRIVKLQKASRILLETKESIAEIAFKAGFANAKHFSTAFKKHFGKTPTEYRQKL